MLLQNPQRIATRNRSVLAGVAGQNNACVTAPGQTAASCRQCRPPRLHPAPPTCRSDNAGFDQQQTLQRHRLESFFSQNIRCRRRRRAEQRFNLRFLAGGDQLAQRRGFARAGQTAQAGDAVTGAQDMINRPVLIFAQPVGRLITGMQRRNRIASRIDRLNQIQFRCQNLPRGKSAFGFHQIRRMTSPPLSTLGKSTSPGRCDKRHVQQFMLRHDRFALENMGDGIVQGLVFQFKPMRTGRTG